MAFKQIDITKKERTEREAIAVGYLKAGKEVIAALKEGKIPKGDALSCAEISGIMGAKLTSQILPLCHPIPISFISVELNIVDEERVEAKAMIKSFSSTGV